MTVKKQCLLVFILALGVRVGLVLATHQYRDVTRYELQKTAYSLATTGVFGNPYAVPTGPTAHVAPGYPLILAGIYKLFGAGERGELIKELVASTVCAVEWGSLPLAGSLLGFPALAGLAAGLLGALVPYKFSAETKGDWEAIYSALVLILIACVTIRIWREKRFAPADGVRSGLAWGVGMLFYPAILPLMVCYLAVGAFLSRRSSFVKFAAIQVALVALALTPWTIRNEISLGSPVFTRTNLGLEVRLSNNDFASPKDSVNFLAGVFHRYHPLQSPREAEQVRAMGEVAYNKMCLSQAVSWVKANPGKFAWLTVQRMFYFWFQPVPGFWIKTAGLAATAALGFFGLYLLWRRDAVLASLLGLMLLVLPLPNYLVHVGLRHRYPVEWILNLLTVFAVWKVYEDRKS